MHSSHHISPRLDHWRRDGCVACDDATPQCNCAAGEKCILTSRTCNECPKIQCLKSSSSKSKGVNPGAIAGPVVAVLVIASLGLFWWLRRKKRRDLARLEALAARARKAESAGFHLSSSPPSPQPGSIHSGNSLPQPPPSAARARSPLPPAPVNAEYYDDHGATIRVYNGSRGTIHLNENGENDPFSDRQSISTMGSGGTANIIPIQYIPPSKSDEALSKVSAAPEAPSGQSAAARALDAARQNLFHPKRPARAPDLDLRLNPPAQSQQGVGTGASQDVLNPPSAYSFLNDRSPSGQSSQYRDSYLSGNSAAPSYWSGQSDVHLDAPKIVTSKQVQIGRLQQAEVVQFGKPQLQAEPLQQQKSPMGGSFSSSSATTRTLTPISNRFDGLEEEMEEGLRSAEPSSAGSGDLRFSMGSLAYDRNSVSTMGTSRYLASAISTGHQAQAQAPAPLQTPASASVAGKTPQQRNSGGSSKSFADSVLGSFPMIPPSDRPPLPSVNSGLLPTSTSTNTLEHLTFSPPSYRPSPQKAGSSATLKKARPDTQASVADSFLGSFPFVAPNREDLADLPTANVPTNASARGVSTTSEGLGGFDFRLAANEDVPPVPTRKE
ncbi:uncharacterized protein I303_105500 [Kwoniella dejecticola CBS 10117]|uniref:Membrane anchor Opy2 N-terminal domain-containing protein n=1 Tax=Kwoniella dejecticola CBS 10117 TaxID=1296121 RepID=A0A1A6A2B0_9TREE|nr:uncharacterized protein I303_05057 [Kwoniella dejecticola CBS 10117]OBR84200.1 hypothetical protein I303_05057 [Kwoniella dejecticola CBS 10117]